MESALDREKIIIRTSIMGIAVNVLLSAGKAAVGIFSNSIAVVLDALNNLSDALSSIITIVGTKLALRPPSKKHPFGHGRMEYLSALVVSVIILYAGVTSLAESVKKILHPTPPEYTAAGLVLLGAAVLAKIVLGLAVKHNGKKANSASLIASGQDALMDSIVSAATVGAALIFIATGTSLEAWLGLVISALIIKSGAELVLETVSQILGERIDASLAKDIKATVVAADKGISGAYDLTLNNYGPDFLLGSVHIEIPADWTAETIDAVTRRIQSAVYEKHNVLLSAVGIYSVNSRNSEAARIRERVDELLKEFPDIIQIHGFFADAEEKKISFDVVVSFDAPDMKAVARTCRERVQALYPGYSVSVQQDMDISD